VKNALELLASEPAVAWSSTVGQPRSPFIAVRTP
jgi:hypothetical protein